MTVAPSPTAVSRSCDPGPTRAPAATVVRPSSWVPGPISTSRARLTPVSIQVVAGSTIVTPAPIQLPSSRALKMCRARASWARSFTPSTSSGSSRVTDATWWPSARRIATTSVRYSSPLALSVGTRLTASPSRCASNA